MDINIGSNLRRLRKAKDVTQEDLAEALGVSFQSVSKWERGDCYPDITMLPSLANYFDVTIDELMGMDEIRNQTFIRDIFKRVHDLEADNRFREVAEVLRQAIKIYPSYYSLQSELAMALSLEDADTEEGEASQKEAIAMSERVLANSTNEKIRSQVRANLCFLHRRVGERQKAIDLARTLPHVWESREMLFPELLGGQEGVEALRRSISIALSVICEKIAIAEGAGQASGTERMLTLGLPECNDTDENKSSADRVDRIRSFMG